MPLGMAKHDVWPRPLPQDDQSAEGFVHNLTPDCEDGCEAACTEDACPGADRRWPYCHIAVPLSVLWGPPHKREWGEGNNSVALV